MAYRSHRDEYSTPFVTGNSSSRDEYENDHVNYESNTTVNDPWASEGFSADAESTGITTKGKVFHVKRGVRLAGKKLQRVVRNFAGSTKHSGPHSGSDDVLNEDGSGFSRRSSSSRRRNSTRRHSATNSNGLTEEEMIQLAVEASLQEFSSKNQEEDEALRKALELSQIETGAFHDSSDDESDVDNENLLDFGGDENSTVPLAQQDNTNVQSQQMVSPSIQPTGTPQQSTFSAAQEPFVGTNQNMFGQQASSTHNVSGAFMQPVNPEVQAQVGSQVPQPLPVLQMSQGQYQQVAPPIHQQENQATQSLPQQTQSPSLIYQTQQYPQQASQPAAQVNPFQQFKPQIATPNATTTIQSTSPF